MFSRGVPSASAHRAVEILEQTLGVAQSALCPGVPLDSVASAMADAPAPVASQGGNAPYGHGVGMDNFEPRLVSVESDLMAEPGMVIAIHPSLVLDERSFYLGDTYAIEESGAYRLSEYPLELSVV